MNILGGRENKIYRTQFLAEYVIHEAIGILKLKGKKTQMTYSQVNSLLREKTKYTLKASTQFSFGLAAPKN